MITWTNVSNIAPKLVAPAVPVATQTQILALVARQVDDTTWGSTEAADDGRTYLAAHFAQLMLRAGGAAGSIIQETLGPMARAYAGVAGASASEIPKDLAQTSYGIVFWGLLRETAAVLGVVP